MKKQIDRRKPSGFLDYSALGITTFGVGYLPLAPGTFGSIVGVMLYVLVRWLTYGVDFGFTSVSANIIDVWANTAIIASFMLFTLAGIWASGRSLELLGDLDPSEAVVDEVIGQLIVFFFVPFAIGWPFVLSGFILFRIFDIWKPYPIDSLQALPGGIGVCADDIIAGVYAGACLAVIYAISISL
ncbi:MAG: phosphatidylglycerophosphatase A [Pyrinomonadaceae bacterium]